MKNVAIALFALLTAWSNSGVSSNARLCQAWMNDRHSVYFSSVELLKTEFSSQELKGKVSKILKLTLRAKVHTKPGVQLRNLKIIVDQGQISADDLLPYNFSELHITANHEVFDLELEHQNRKVQVFDSTESIQFPMKLIVETNPVDPTHQLKKEDKIEARLLYLNIDGGLRNGLNLWHLYEVDARDLSNIKFAKVKTYSLSRGEVTDYAE